ncbi:MAG: ExbD/TolR family protein [Gammaproteobacteria bacterium]
MSGSRIARRQARSHARRHGKNDINIVPMLDVMVILIFFLIFTAVFSKTRILELDLPAEVPQELEKIEQLELEVIIRQGAIEVADRNTGLLQSFPRDDAKGDLKPLSDYLARVKARFPGKKDATVLPEPEVPYDTIVQVMDAVRSYDGMQDGQPARGELFPQVALGDAPQ